jgi:hypothetical protein
MVILISGCQYITANTNVTKTSNNATIAITHFKQLKLKITNKFESYIPDLI